MRIVSWGLVLKLFLLKKILAVPVNSVWDSLKNMGVNSIMGPSFEIVFAEKSTCESCEQYMGPTEKHGTQLKSAFQYYPNIHFEQSLNKLIGHFINYKL